MTKQEALKVVHKFDLEQRSGKELFFKLVHKGQIILTTAIPKGKGELHIEGQFRKQLRLSEYQLMGARKCPFKKSDYYAHLRAIGKLPDED